MRLNIATGNKTSGSLNMGLALGDSDGQSIMGMQFWRFYGLSTWETNHL